MVEEGWETCNLKINKILGHIYKMEYHSAEKKEETATFCDIMGGTGDYHA